MRILAFNASPRPKGGAIHQILHRFLGGACSQGAEAETLYLRLLNIKPCLRCFNCWYRTPGRCHQKDDMASILEKIQPPDLLIFATPFCVFTMTPYMKALLDRTTEVEPPSGLHQLEPRN